MDEADRDDAARWAAQAASFGSAADAYERGRPGYPEEAIDWLLPPGARDVLDLGAGTGKLTRQLTSRAVSVIAVEPSTEMRAQLERSVPEARALPGQAEAIPLPDGSVDAVLVAQAWHWVNPVRAVPEVARVLRPGGWLGLLWNTRAPGPPWVMKLGRLMTGGMDHFDRGRPPIGPPFDSFERRDFPWAYRLSPEMLVDMVASRSYVITAPADRQKAILDDVRGLIREEPGLAGHQEVEMPYVTQCSRAVRP